MNKNIKRNLPLIGIGLIFVLLIMLFIASRAGGNAVRDRIISEKDAAAYLSGYGWELSEQPSSVKNVEIPAEFTALYESYNQLQKSQGFDLSEYRSKTAIMYTFRVLNHTSPDDVFANLLVINGNVIAGDVISYALDGFITGLDGELLL